MANPERSGRKPLVWKTTEAAPLNDTYLSGKPYYCRLCGLGYGEYLACEEPDCELETTRQAQERLQRARAAQTPERSDQ